MALYTETNSSTQLPGANRRLVVWGLAGAAMLWIGLLGPAWTYVPAQPDANIPAADLSFAALAALTTESPSVVQATYFGWLAWVFVLVSTALVVLAVRTRNPLASVLCVAAGVVQLLVTVLAIKGPLPWSVVVDGLTNTRLGAALAIAGILSVIAAGIFGLSGAPEDRSDGSK